MDSFPSRRVSCGIPSIQTPFRNKALDASLLTISELRQLAAALRRRGSARPFGRSPKPEVLDLVDDLVDEIDRLRAAGGLASWLALDVGFSRTRLMHRGISKPVD